MIAVPPGVRILLAPRPVDFRKGMDGLAALVQQALRADPFRGDVFIFRAKRADRVKILVYDGTGLCLYTPLQALLGELGRDVRIRFAYYSPTNMPDTSDRYVLDFA